MNGALYFFLKEKNNLKVKKQKNTLQLQTDINRNYIRKW